MTELEWCQTAAREVFCEDIGYIPRWARQVDERKR